MTNNIDSESELSKWLVQKLILSGSVFLMPLIAFRSWIVMEWTRQDSNLRIKSILRMM